MFRGRLLRIAICPGYPAHVDSIINPQMHIVHTSSQRVSQLLQLLLPYPRPAHLSGFCLRMAQGEVCLSWIFCPVVGYKSSGFSKWCSVISDIGHSALPATCRLCLRNKACLVCISGTCADFWPCNPLYIFIVRDR